MTTNNTSSACNPPVTSKHNKVVAAILWLLPTLALLITAAHFYRQSNMGMALFSIGIIILWGIGKKWHLLVVAIALFLAGFEWLYTGYSLALYRIATETPWMRAAAILTGVAAFTFISAIMVWKKYLAVNQQNTPPSPPPPSSPLPPNNEKTETSLCTQSAHQQHVASAGNAVPAPSTAAHSTPTMAQSTPTMAQSTRNDNAATLVTAATFVAVSVLLSALSARITTMPLLVADRFWYGLGGAQVFFVAWYGATVATALTQRSIRRAKRLFFWRLFSLVFFAQLVLGVIALPQMLMTGILHLPIPAFIVFSPLYQGTFGIMPFLLVGSVLLAGSAWCSHLCYFGAWDNQCAISTKNKLPATIAQPFWVTHNRLLILITGSCIAIGLRVTKAPTWCVAVTVVIFIAASIAVMLLLSRRRGIMMHCTHICPIGFIVNTLAKVSPWRMRINQATCTQCNACQKVCRYNAITPASRAKGTTAFSCSLCQDCTTVCAHNAVQLQLLRWNHPAVQYIFIVVTTTLHALFIGVARV